MSLPTFRAVGDHALLVEFGDKVSNDTNQAVHQLVRALAAQPFEGFEEAVPAFVNILIDFDPLVTDHETVESFVNKLLSGSSEYAAETSSREVLVCYEDVENSDLAEVARLTGLSTEAVINAHLAGDYSVYMYGFAPGYAYLASVPEEIRLPRKDSAIRGIKAGSVLIAGPQCLVTTITMPTGWWIIGKSPTLVLTGDDDNPFLFDVGDPVVFRRVTQDEYDAAMAGA
jgi:inhibitor of KinA